MRGNVDGSATDHLLCSEANAERLRSSVAQMKAGDTVSVQVENLTMQGLEERRNRDNVLQSSVLPRTN